MNDFICVIQSFLIRGSEIELTRGPNGLRRLVKPNYNDPLSVFFFFFYRGLNIFCMFALLQSFQQVNVLKGLFL